MFVGVMIGAVLLFLLAAAALPEVVEGRRSWTCPHTMPSSAGVSGCCSPPLVVATA